MIEIYIGFAVLGLFILHLMITKVGDSSIPSNLYDTERKVNELYKAYMKPLAEEYRVLKGYEGMEQYSDSVIFLYSRKYIDHGYNGPVEREIIDTAETVKYSELPVKLGQLKKYMKRGCEIYCSENK